MLASCCRCLHARAELESAPLLGASGARSSRAAQPRSSHAAALRESKDPRAGNPFIEDNFAAHSVGDGAQIGGSSARSGDERLRIRAEASGGSGSDGSVDGFGGRGMRGSTSGSSVSLDSESPLLPWGHTAPPPVRVVARPPMYVPPPKEPVLISTPLLPWGASSSAPRPGVAREAGGAALQQLQRAPSSSAPPLATTTTLATLECGICLDRTKDAALDPCGHTACSECAAALRTCHVCRARVTRVQRMYL